MAHLSIKSVSKAYDGLSVLSDISFNVKKGEWIGIVGESGSGKSTLLNIIGRTIDADEGAEIVLMGNKLNLVRDQLLKGHESIKLVHQEYGLFPNQTARENIAYALRFYEPSYQKSRVEELLRLTRLKEVEHRKAKLLSGGEKQRTALARALAEPPELLLLDEPFAHLDPKNKQTLSEAIVSLKQTDRLTCIFVTHDASEAMAWADRLLILREGKIVQEGAPEFLYGHPNSLYVAELTGLVNLIGPSEDAGWLSIRPNFIRPVQSMEKAAWKARITGIRFKGSYYEYYCLTDQGTPLVYFSSRKKQQVGDPVYLAYSKKNVRKIANPGSMIKG